MCWSSIWPVEFYRGWEHAEAICIFAGGESPAGSETFIGDYFGNITVGTTDVTTFVSTYDDGTNPDHRQQQVIAQVAIP